MEFIKQDASGVIPGADWNILVAKQRGSRHHVDYEKKTIPTDLLRELGSYVGAASASFAHEGMLEEAANRCIEATEPPFSRDEKAAFREGVMSLYSVARSLEMLSRGGN